MTKNYLQIRRINSQEVKDMFNVKEMEFDPSHSVEEFSSKNFNDEPQELKEMNSRDQMLFKQLKEELKEIDIDEKELEEESKRSMRENIKNMPRGLPGRDQARWMWYEGGAKDIETKKLQIDARRWENQKQFYKLAPKDRAPTKILEHLLEDLYNESEKVSDGSAEDIFSHAQKITTIENELLRRNNADAVRQINQIANSFSTLQTQNLTEDTRIAHKIRIYRHLRSLADKGDHDSINLLEKFSSRNIFNEKDFSSRILYCANYDYTDRSHTTLASHYLWKNIFDKKTDLEHWITYFNAWDEDYSQFMSYEYWNSYAIFYEISR